MSATKQVKVINTRLFTKDSATRPENVVQMFSKGFFYLGLIHPLTIWQKKKTKKKKTYLSHPKPFRMQTVFFFKSFLECTSRTLTPLSLNPDIVSRELRVAGQREGQNLALVPSSPSTLLQIELVFFGPNFRAAKMDKIVINMRVFATQAKSRVAQVICVR